jgi:hypothetical protein
MTPNTELSDERIFGLAKQHFGGSGHNLIWQDDPRYAAACDMTTDARWSVSAVRAEQTLAFARAILAASPAPLREADATPFDAFKDLAGRFGWDTQQEHPGGLFQDKALQAAWDTLARNPLSGIEADGDGGKGMDLREAAHALETALRFAQHKIAPTPEEIVRWREIMYRLKAAPTSPSNGKTEGDGNG